MKKPSLALLLALCLLTGAAGASGALAGDAPVPGTIVRHPPAADAFLREYYGQTTLEERLTPGTYGVVNLMGLDLSGVDLTEQGDLLGRATFDMQTRWPDALPEGFDPALLMAQGADPGCGVRALHARGITGKGVGIGILDLTLLTGHVEYADRLRFYEETMPDAEQRIAEMHGAAVASLALGETVGVAPDALLYYIAMWPAVTHEDGTWKRDCRPAAEGIERLLLLNEQLPEGERIRVISISIGWMPDALGVAEMEAAIEHARQQGVQVIAVNTLDDLRISGMGREPGGDPNDPAAVRAGLFWEKDLQRGQGNAFYAGNLLLPMDSRTVASFRGDEDYIFYRDGGMSWVAPYLAGLYALALEAYPDVTLDEVVQAAHRTATTIRYTHTNGNIYRPGKMLDAVALFDRLGEGR